MRKETLVVYYNDANATPIRAWDYIANVEGDEEFGPYGYGCNQDEALLHLMGQLIERGFI